MISFLLEGTQPNDLAYFCRTADGYELWVRAEWSPYYHVADWAGASQLRDPDGPVRCVPLDRRAVTPAVEEIRRLFRE